MAEKTKEERMKELEDFINYKFGEATYRGEFPKQRIWGVPKADYDNWVARVKQAF